MASTSEFTDFAGEERAPYYPPMFAMRGVDFVGDVLVPGRVYVWEDDDGAFFVEEERGEDWKPEAKGLLEDFATLARAGSGRNCAKAVAEFVYRFGGLQLCSEHHRPYLPEHSHCTTLGLEPVSVWMEHAVRVSRVLLVVDTLARGRLPGPLDSRNQEGVLYRDDIERIVGLAIERSRRDFSGSGDAARALHDMFQERLQKVSVRPGQSSGSIEEEGLPSTASDWREWVAREVEDGLAKFPSRLGFVFEPDSEKFLPKLESPSGILSEVYLSLSLRVAGAKAWALCDACGRPHSRQRAPKRRQRAYCPQCAGTSAPQRLHMRGKRHGRPNA